jgi:hypothetical protein
MKTPVTHLLDGTAVPEMQADQLVAALLDAGGEADLEDDVDMAKLLYAAANTISTFSQRSAL